MKAAVRIIKLVTGEDIIGVVNEAEIANGKKVLEVKAPHYIMMRPKKESTNEFVLGLSPYAPYAKNSIIAFVPGHIISVCDPNEDLFKEYSRRFREGIVTTEDETVQQVLKEA